MAPRTAKAKKTASTKVAENEAPKKGRGKTKTVEEPEIDALENEAGDAPVVEKKSKRGKKGESETNGQEETNGVAEEKAPAAKKGRKKKADTPEKSEGDADEDKASNPEETEEQADSNGHAEEVPASGGRGKKKPTKKEAASKPKPEPKTSGRAKKNTKDTETEAEKEEASEELVKPAAKGRGRKAPQKADKEPETHENGDGDAKVKESPNKGRKRGPAKPAKENTPESELGEQDVEDKPAEEPKKKEAKGKKNQAKKPLAKSEADEEEEAKPEPASKKRKVTKKDIKDEVKDEEPAEESAPEPKPLKGKRGQKKEAEAEEAAEAGDPAGKRRRKAADEKVSTEDTKNKAPLKNKASTDYESIDFSNSSKTVQGKEWNLKIASWNVDGIRAWLSKGGLDYIKYEKPDILCLQETKCAKDKLPEEIANLPGYHAYWQGSDKEGYAGVGIYTTKLAMSVQYGLQNEELDNEGRIITAEYEQFYLICTYVPNAGRKLVTLPRRLQWNEEFRKYVKELDKKKPVIICGDMNVAHDEIDLANPKANKKNAGFTVEERTGMSELLKEGFVDSYRHLRPHETGAYTFWTYMMNSRAKNVGWRLDYFLLSERLIPSLCDNVIRSEVYGSDHCPITLFMHMTSAVKPKE